MVNRLIMKKLIVVSFILLVVLACKKKEFSPEGPTDVRIRNLSDQTFQEVILGTSENTADIDTLGTVASGAVTEYFRYTKAYPKAEITVKINIGGSPVTFTTGPVNYTYLTYIGQDRITFEVYISSMNNRELTISNVVLDEPLVVK
jgi:hypothetical protein